MMCLHVLVCYVMLLLYYCTIPLHWWGLWLFSISLCFSNLCAYAFFILIWIILLGYIIVIFFVMIPVNTTNMLLWWTFLDPTEILAWKVSLPLMANKAIDNFRTVSIDKGKINNEKELTMSFVKGYNCWENTFGDALLCPNGCGKEEFTNTYIWLTKSIQIYIFIHIHQENNSNGNEEFMNA